MANKSVYKQGDTDPKYGPVTLKGKNGAAIDLSGAEEVHMWMRGEGLGAEGADLIVETSPMTGPNGGALDATGVVEYEWEPAEGEEPADLDTPGVFQIEYVITWAPGRYTTVPNSEYDEVEVLPNLRGVP